MILLRYWFMPVVTLMSLSVAFGFVAKFHEPEAEQQIRDALSERRMGHLTASRSTCCVRIPKTVSVGDGLDGDVFVDVGQCRQSCTNKKTKINRKEFDAVLKANHHIDPVELFFAMQRDMSSNSCAEESTHCLPVRTVVERHMTMTGLKEVAVIESCSCLPDPELCHRVQEHIIHYPGTPFETSVDVGRCSGPCNAGETLTHCQPTRNKTIAIPGPNGDTCVEVIESCGCTSSCFRASSLEHVYDYSHSDGIENDPVTKVIDVGKCVGTCNSAHQHKQRCVMRDKNDHTKCLMSLTRADNHCTPLGFELHHYKSRNGTDKSILSITDCGCQ